MTHQYADKAPHDSTGTSSDQAANKPASRAMTPAEYADFAVTLFADATEAARALPANATAAALTHAADETNTRVRRAIIELTMLHVASKTDLSAALGPYLGELDRLHAQVAHDPSPEGQERAAKLASTEEMARDLAPKVSAKGMASRPRINRKDAELQIHLARLELQACRQHLIQGWDALVAGNPSAIANAKLSLDHANQILVNPAIDPEFPEIFAQVAILDHVFNNVCGSILADHPGWKSLAESFATSLDRTFTALGKPVTALERVHSLGAKQDGADDKHKTTGEPASGVKIAAANPAKPIGPEYADSHTFTRKVVIVDTNFSDEVLGYIELTMAVVLTTSGAIQIVNASATPVMEGRAREFLSFATAQSTAGGTEKGQSFAEITFDTTMYSVAKSEDSGLSAEVSLPENVGKIGASEKTTRQSRAGAPLRRAYRYTAGDTYWSPEMLASGEAAVMPHQIHQQELLNRRRDVENFEIDDDDAGDTWTTLYANWELKSGGD